MTFVFHSGEGDSDDRVVHEEEARERNSKDEPRWRVHRIRNERYILQARFRGLPESSVIDVF